MLPFVYLTLPQASLASPNGEPLLLPPTKTLNKKKKGKGWGRKKERNRFSDSGCPAFRAQVTRMLFGGCTGRFLSDEMGTQPFRLETESRRIWFLPLFSLIATIEGVMVAWGLHTLQKAVLRS